MLQSSPQTSANGGQLFETGSPRDRAILVRVGASRTVRVEKRQAHRFTRSLLDSARALEVVEIRKGVIKGS